MAPLGTDAASKTVQRDVCIVNLVLSGAEDDVRAWLGTPDGDANLVVELNGISICLAALAMYRGASVMRVLLQNGADPDAVAMGQRLLVTAIQQDLNEVVELLLEFGASVAPPAGAGMSPLRLAAFKHKVDTVRLLLRHGARPDDVVSGVIKSGPPNLLAILLRAGADPNVLPNSPFPPLFYAASLSDDRSEVVRVLLRYGARVDMTRHGATAEDAARHLGGHANSINLLSDVLAAGSWRAHVREPCVQLLLLRVLCQRGRASAPRGPLKRLFSASFRNSGAKRAARGASLPDSLFWVVLSYWRSSRQVGPPDHEADDDELQAWMANQG